MDRETVWAVKLQEEHEDICYQRRINMFAPVVEIIQSKSKLGSWNPGKGIIGISGHLIQTQTWETVIEVLKHEMAHQYVTLFLDGNHGHGASFKHACAILGVHPAFAGSCTAREGDAALQAFKGQLPETAQKMLSKIEKLMALGTSDNEAEARAASQKASYLLNKYNLDRSRRDVEADPVHYIVITHKKKRITSLEKDVAAILKKYYFVNVVLTSTYDPDTCEEYKSITLIGKKAALEVAEYAYHFLRDTGERLWQAYRKKNKIRRGRPMFDHGYSRGLVENHEKALYNACEDARDGTLPAVSGRSLVEKAKADLRGETGRLFPRLSTTRRTVSGSQATYEAGIEKGRQTFVNKPVSQGHAGERKYLQ